MHFVAKQGDTQAEKALAILGNLGHTVTILSEADTAPSTSVAVFTPTRQAFQGSKRKYLRCSAIKLGNDLAPTWVHTTKLRVAVIRTERPERKREHRWMNKRKGFETAVEEMERHYQRWLAEDNLQPVPWSYSTKDPSITPGSKCQKAVKAWIELSSVLEFRRTWIIKKSGVQKITTEICGWQVNHTQVEFPFLRGNQTDALALLAKWSGCFAPEETWVRQRHGVPSLVVRIDCIVRNSQLIVYEVEERPAGMGLSCVVNPYFPKTLEGVARTWPEFEVKVSPKRRATDDSLWIKALNWQMPSPSPLKLVRAEPEETEFHAYEVQSVSSVKAKGNKSYGLAMGLWQQVVNTSELLWDESFVLKPLQGSKLKDLEIWDPQGRPGASKRKQIEEALLRNQTMYCQKLHPPMETGIPEYPWMIYRVFFGYDLALKTWVCLGGNWNARYNLRIHGASDALFGPLCVD